MKIEIKNSYTNEIIIEGEYESLKNAVEMNKFQLSNANLINANLRNAYLDISNFIRADLAGANLEYADLRSADFICANLECANLGNADLRCANLECANLKGANLEDADLSAADFIGANFRNTNFKDTIYHRDILNKAPFQFYGLEWHILITNLYIEIGCESHTREEWEAFSDEEINKMDKDALKFWIKNKEFIFAMHDKYTIKLKKRRKQKNASYIFVI